jgi:hypothetical protein
MVFHSVPSYAAIRFSFMTKRSCAAAIVIYRMSINSRLTGAGRDSRSLSANVR